MKFIYNNFDLLFDKAVSVEAFKKLILEMAVRGKLVPQDPNDEPASVFLEKIQKEKERLIKEGVLKKDKHLPTISEEETLFKLPDGWEWIRLGDICRYIQRGKSPTYSDIKKIPVVAQKCIQWSGFDISKAKFIDPETLESYSEERFLESQDLMWNSTGVGTLGRINAYEANKIYEKVVVDSHVTVIRSFKKYVDSNFLLHWFSSPIIQREINDKAFGSTKQTELATSTIKKYIVPLPPLNEQKRIVNKIDEVFDKIQKYQEALEQRENHKRQLNQASLNKLTNTRNRDEFVKSVQFVVSNFDALYDTPESIKELRQAILNLAVQGKLVPQDPNDEPAGVLLEKIQKEKERLIKEGIINQEKPLPMINKDEVPYDLPNGWKWVRLGEICNYIQRGKSPVYSEIRKIPVVSQKCIQWSGFDISRAKYVDPDTLDNYAKERFLEPLDLMWNSTGVGTLGRVNIFEGVTKYEKVVADSHVTVVRPAKSFIDSRFLFIWFASPEVQNEINNIASGSTKQTELSTSTVKEHIVPLPPINEQKRIVSLLDANLHLCDELYLRIEQCNDIVCQILSLEVI